jgi:hypothetical protein
VYTLIYSQLSRIGKKESLKGLKILDSNVYDLAGFGTDLVEVNVPDLSSSLLTSYPSHILTSYPDFS